MPISGVCGFECASTVHWTLNNASYNTSTVRTGARSLRINGTSTSNMNGQFNDFTVLVSSSSARVYINFASLPTQNYPILTLKLVSNIQVGILFNSSTSELRTGSVTDGGAYTFASSGISVTTGIWYRLEVKSNVTSNPWLIDGSVDGTSLTQFSNAVAGDFINGLNLGRNGTITASTTVDMYFDDFAHDPDGILYPIGEGYVHHFVPTSDGTHTATTTTIVKGTIAAPTGGGNVAGATDVFNWVNGVPLLGGATGNTRLVNQQTAGVTLYAEVVFGPAPGIPTPVAGPRCISALTAHRQASTAAGSFSIRMNDNGTESVLLTVTSSAGVVTDRFKVLNWTNNIANGFPWTVVSGAGNFNNLRARFGYSGDATPDQYWRGIMVEAEFSGTAPVGTYRRLGLLGVG